MCHFTDIREHMYRIPLFIDADKLPFMYYKTVASLMRPMLTTTIPHQIS